MHRGLEEYIHIETIKPRDWREYYKNLLTEQPEYFKENMNISRVEIQGELTDIDITGKEAIRCLKNGKASGRVVISELLRNGTEKLFKMLSDIISQFLNCYPVPEEWKTAFITSIYKEGDRNRFGNYRLISVMSTESKLCGRI